MRRLSLVAGLCAIALSTAPSQAAPAVLQIQAWRFNPTTVTVDRGDPVVIVNIDGASNTPHTVTSCIPNGAHSDCVVPLTKSQTFDTGTIIAATVLQTGSIVKGKYPFYCQIHNGMRAVLVVS